MTRQRHLHRTAVFATACAVFAATATGSALAWNGTVKPVEFRTVHTGPAPHVVASNVPSTVPPARAGVARVTARAAAPRPAATSSTRKVRATSVTRTASTRTHAVSAPRSRKAPQRAAHAVTISRYVDAPGSQAAIDKCKLVLWTRAPLWLAGHNWCGYQWMAYVATGTVVHVTSGAAAGTYVVTGHKKLSRQSGSLPHLSADLVLQTCVGSGTGLTLLRRV